MDTDEFVIHAFHYFYDKYKSGDYPSDEQLLRFSGPPILDTFKREFPNQDANKLKQEFMDISKSYYDRYLKLFPDEIEVLNALKNKGYLLAIVTNKTHLMASYCLEKAGISHLFDMVIGDGDVNNNKPDPEGINKILGAYHINKDEAIYVGDNDIDYVTAHNAGIDSILVTWAPRDFTLLDKANYRINSYKELEKLL